MMKESTVKSRGIKTIMIVLLVLLVLVLFFLVVRRTYFLKANYDYQFSGMSAYSSLETVISGLDHFLETGDISTAAILSTNFSLWKSEWSRIGGACYAYAENSNKYLFRGKLKYNSISIETKAQGLDIRDCYKGFTDLWVAFHSLDMRFNKFISEGKTPQNDADTLEYVQKVREQIIWLNDLYMNSGVFVKNEDAQKGVINYNGFSQKPGSEEFVVLYLAFFREFSRHSIVFLDSII